MERKKRCQELLTRMGPSYCVQFLKEEAQKECDLVTCILCRTFVSG